ncbi:MAG TPA: DUF302 domain-containing protein [Gammaproteobacteria bacterium]|nr:DUF302 domain-containing protein [Gammaproteobacteria bacterium]
MYGFSINLNERFEDVIALVAEALKEQGFSILTVIDVKKTLKDKIDADLLPYTILGACNPQLARQALDVDPDVGLLLPCNVVVRQEDDASVTVVFMEPEAILGLVDKPGIEALVAVVREKLEHVRIRVAVADKTVYSESVVSIKP